MLTRLPLTAIAGLQTLRADITDVAGHCEDAARDAAREVQDTARHSGRKAPGSSERRA
ncbi:hypothetical protein Plo01_78670 [Planobispora longispora]|uniref:Uncharacterized protein n=1 Tax=Planobispora longispora TaxID=28887 RepID=A0A8J3WA27_9ACTN|nr:hypothetical protein Plo01_78670 [Planobispora longispora]